MPRHPAAREDGRLRKRSDFLAAARGRRFHTELMTVQSIARADASTGAPAGIRVGLTVTKKAGHAAERNRIRRRLRHAVLAARATWPKADIDVVVVARREALAAPFPRLVEDLTRALPSLVKPRGRPRNADRANANGPER